MLERYHTVQLPGSSEIVIKKSRFIGHARPVDSEEEALRFIEAVRKEHWNATHNCFAYMIGDRDEIQKQSDDGEPSGTAGKPILEVIKHRKLKYVAVVVTRYFGGIMLGAGGLIRAYTDGAVAGIDAARPIAQMLHREVRVALDYTWLGKAENELRGRGTLMGETLFAENVTLLCLPLEAEAPSFIAWMTDLTQGQAVITRGEARYVAQPLDGSGA
ncbi:YigZ family protein [Paenibacillus cymbidii]|uniref:YigZ family protein n=1 Tax=Paenibacillus cymbidii TaxID=1639034 RepID=UPI0010814AE3|nr:YigZ family protein [Paenibacillus cymbidii]